jgi:hypothetical protein
MLHERVISLCLFQSGGCVWARQEGMGRRPGEMSFMGVGGVAGVSVSDASRDGRLLAMTTVLGWVGERVGSCLVLLGHGHGHVRVDAVGCRLSSAGVANGERKGWAAPFSVPSVSQPVPAVDLAPPPASAQVAHSRSRPPQTQTQTQALCRD